MINQSKTAFNESYQKSNKSSYIIIYVNEFFSLKEMFQKEPPRQKGKQVVPLFTALELRKTIFTNYHILLTADDHLHVKSHHN